MFSKGNRNDTSSSSELNTNRLTSDETCITWYLDSCLDNEKAQGESTDLTYHQPWRSYWPPKCQKTTEMWLRSEFPEVLSWRFDRARPFDRPWRTWNRSVRAMEEYSVRFKPQAKITRREGSSRAGSSSILLAKIVEIHDAIDFMKLPCVEDVPCNFLVPLSLYNTEKPYLSRLPCGSDLPRTNIFTESHHLDVYNVSGNETSFSLDDSGFQFSKFPVEVSQWTDSYVCSEYIPRLEEWLTQHLKCSSSFIYAYSFRGRDVVNSGGSCPKTPFLRAHCDVTEASCLKRLQLYFQDTAQTLMKSRVRFINIWRAISTPDQDCPLAFCDFRTVNRQDLIKADIVFPHYQDEGYEVCYNPDQRWFYKPGIERDDVVLFKLADNLPGSAPFCPHSAFMDPSVAEGTPSRSSIEVRSIIFD